MNEPHRPTSRTDDERRRLTETTTLDAKGPAGDFGPPNDSHGGGDDE